MIDENELPDSWSVKTIDDVIVNAKNGGTPKKSNHKYWDGDIDWVNSGEVRGKYTETSENTITQKALKETSAKMFPQDSVLIAMYGGEGTVGRATIVREPVSGNQAICCLDIDEDIASPEYVYYYSMLLRKRLEKLARGGSQDNINQSIILEQKIPVPPLNEQERIIKGAEERLERVERLKKSVENAGRYTTEYRDSLIKYLFIGRESLSTQSPEQIPTKEDIPNDWKIKNIGEVSSQIRTGGTPKKSEQDYWGGDIPWKASKHFNQNSIQLDKSSEYVTDEGKEESTMAHPNDVVIVCRGAHTGKVALAQSEFLFNQDVKVIRLPDSLHSKFVAHYLSNHMEYFLQKQRGGTTKGITTDHVKTLRIPIPPNKKQEEIVSEVESIDFSKISKAISDVGILFDEYKDSVLAHTFNGHMRY